MAAPRSSPRPAAGLPAGTVVLGIDPGTRVAGYGAVRYDGDRAWLLEAGVIRVAAARSLPERLGRMAEELEQLVANLAPTVVVVERAFASKNVATAIRLGEGRGLALAAAARAGAQVVELAPASAKKTLTGHGRAGKGDVAALVALALGIDAVGAPADATDALSLALAWLFTRPGLGLRRAAPGNDAGPRGGQRVGRSAASALPSARRQLSAAGRPGQRRAPRSLGGA